MNISFRIFSILCSVLLTLGSFSSQATAQAVFIDDFENRVQDQPQVGNNWTWFDQTFAGDTCVDDPIGLFGPFSDGDGSDYLVDNRNYFTASADVGQGDSYYRAGLEVPAWEGALSNMLRVYGNQFNNAITCQRVLVFQEWTIAMGGGYVFSFDVAQDQFGAPANGEITAAFVKVLKTSDESFTTLLFETVLTTPPAATSPGDVSAATQTIEFSIPEELVGELLQFGFYNDIAPRLGQSWATSAALYDNVTLSPVEIGPAHSGSFFNEGQSGHGFSVEFGYDFEGMPQAVIYWYTYDNMGNPIFMIGTGAPDGQTVVIEFISPVGMVYGEFDPDSVVREAGGTGVFVFSDQDNATFTYTPSEFSMTNWGHMSGIDKLPLTKLFGIPADENFNMPQ